MIRFERVSIGFDGRPLFENLSFEVPAGGKVLLVSPSGSGKSSVLKALLGFIPLRSGNIYVNGERLDKKTVWWFRKTCAYVPQNTDLGEGKVAEVLNQIWGYKAAGAKAPPLEEIAGLSGEFGLPESMFEQEYEKLSGGEKQRLAFIIAAALGRSVMLLDEPASSLDGERKELVKNYIAAHKDWTVLAVSHDREWTDGGVFSVIDLEDYACSPR